MDYKNIKEIQEKITKLKKEKNAIILAHYYQAPEVQDVSDYVGDSYALSKIAKDTDAKIIVFCGVHFMAETAKILSPQKKVLLANLKAGCPMADMIDEIKLRAYKEKHPDTLVICYVNTSATVKALSDVCVTSSNALKIIKHFQKKNKPIVYVPDIHLANYANSIMDDDMAKIDLWPGYCLVHDAYTLEEIRKKKEMHPNALVLVHPESPLEVCQAADFVGSTQGIIDYATKSDAKEFIIATEVGIMHPLKKANPDKVFIPLSDKAVCWNMKKTSLEDVYQTLLEERNEIFIDDDILAKASRALNLMIEIQES